jgi:hypothetical protein
MVKYVIWILGHDDILFAGGIPAPNGAGTSVTISKGDYFQGVFVRPQTGELMAMSISRAKMAKPS